MLGNLVIEQLKQLPASPGVYIMKDAEDNILYVGKAANLRQRVASYFGAKQGLSLKLEQLVSRIADLDFLVTNSEQEALILELNLIKRHHPRYNVRLKDDKTFPYLKITVGEEWPRIYMTRRLEQDGGRYFGPFTSAKSVRQTLKVLRGIFPFRSCTRPINGADSRACLEYHMGRCVGPCLGGVSQQEYADVIREVSLFLEGKQEKIVRELEDKMNRAAEALDFEKAARIRDQIQALNRVVEGQRIAAAVKGEQDVIAFAQDKDQACVQVFFVSEGKLIGREGFVLQGTRSEEPSQIMTSFVKQFYNSAPYVPPRLLLQYPVEDEAIIGSWLSEKRGSKVKIQVPRRGVKRKLVDIVSKNARQCLAQLIFKQLVSPTAISTALAEIQEELYLPHAPLRMEGYDISNIRGKAAVGSMVVFEQGKAKPVHYRRFKIKTVAGADDYAMLREVLKRRFKRIGSAGDTWATLPDFILIDGGRGQLNAALAAMAEAGISIPVASLAKENEEIFIPDKSEPIVLRQSSPGLQLLQRLRDEAHRFAISYYQKVHKKETFASVLDAILGIGPKRKAALWRRFGSVQAIREASMEEIAGTPGMSKGLAKTVKEHLS